MESKTNYTIVGVAVVLLLFGLIITGLWLSEGFDRKSYRYYTVYMEEAVSGLGDDALVKYNGVKVGEVSDITLDKNPQLVKLILKIEEDTPITASTVAYLIPQGITGTTYLGLTVTSDDLTPLIPTPGEPYPVIPYRPSLLSQVEKAVTDFSKTMNNFLSKENADNFNRILFNFQQISKVIAVNDQALQETLQQMPKLTEDLRKSMVLFGEASKQLSTTMTSGEYVFNYISQQTIPPVSSMLRRMDVIAGNFEHISADLRRNPSSLIRRLPPPKKGPGE